MIALWVGVALIVITVLLMCGATAFRVLRLSREGATLISALRTTYNGDPGAILVSIASFSSGATGAMLLAEDDTNSGVIAVVGLGVLCASASARALVPRKASSFLTHGPMAGWITAIVLLAVASALKNEWLPAFLVFCTAADTIPLKYPSERREA